MSNTCLHPCNLNLNFQLLPPIKCCRVLFIFIFYLFPLHSGCNVSFVLRLLLPNKLVGRGNLSASSNSFNTRCSFMSICTEHPPAPGKQLKETIQAKQQRLVGHSWISPSTLSMRRHSATHGIQLLPLTVRLKEKKGHPRLVSRHPSGRAVFLRSRSTTDLLTAPNLPQCNPSLHQAAQLLHQEHLKPTC